MKTKKILVILLLLTVTVGFMIGSVSSVDAASYKATVKFKKDKYFGPTYERDGFQKEWFSGKKGKYGGSAEVYLYKKGNKVTKQSYLRFSDDNGGSKFKAKVTFRYWNGYKYTNKYKTKTYTKKPDLAYLGGGIGTKNWIPVSAKVYA